MVQALLAGVLGFTAADSMAAEKVFDRSFSVRPDGQLTVNADGAAISVVGSDANQVVIHVVANASQKNLDQLQFSASQTDSGVTVELLRPKSRLSWLDWGSWDMDAHIEVKVPRTYRIDAKTSGGDVRLDAVSGPSRLRTSGGGVDLRNVKGDIEGYTSGGDIHADSIEGPIRVHTSGGSIHAANVRGDIDADTSGGDVRLLHIDGKIRANTSGGNVQCELVGANRGISATTSGGDVRLTLPKDIRGTLDAQSSGGDIVTDFPIATTRVVEHRLNGPINGGGETIHARTSGGDIKLSAGK
jgi:hypothetical protein